MHLLFSGFVFDIEGGAAEPAFISAGTLDEWKATHRTVAEGADTALSAVELGKRHGVELPLCEQVHAILYQKKSPLKALSELMERAPKTEVWK